MALRAHLPRYTDAVNLAGGRVLEPPTMQDLRHMERSVGSTAPPARSKICGVCGDAARCHHFGGLCCASCKAFFRRSVVKDQYKEYRCIYGGSCAIDVTTRKHCSHCRLKNCLAIGMDKKWFMSEEMRAELKRKALLKASQTNRTNDNNRLWLPARPFRPDQDRCVYLTDQQIGEIKSLLHLCLASYRTETIPESAQSDSCHASPARVAVIFATCIRRCMIFIQNVPQFRQLKLSLQTALMRLRIMEVLIILGSLTYDMTAKAWSHKGHALMNEPRTVHVCINDFTGLHGEAVMVRHFDVMCYLLNLGVDREIVILLALVAFFTQENDAAREDPSLVALQDHFIHLLKMYLRWKFGPSECENVFTRIILKLGDVREANELHRISQLRLSPDEIHEVERNVGGLKLVNEPVTNVMVHPTTESFCRC